MVVAATAVTLTATVTNPTAGATVTGTAGDFTANYAFYACGLGSDAAAETLSIDSAGNLSRTNGVALGETCRRGAGSNSQGTGNVNRQTYTLHPDDVSDSANYIFYAVWRASPAFAGISSTTLVQSVVPVRGESGVRVTGVDGSNSSIRMEVLGRVSQLTPESFVVYRANTYAGISTAPVIGRNVFQNAKSSPSHLRLDGNKYVVDGNNSVVLGSAGTWFVAVSGGTVEIRHTPPDDGLGGRNNPIVLPTVANPAAPTAVTASHSATEMTISWQKAAHRHSRFSIYYGTSAGFTPSDDARLRVRPDCAAATAAGACTVTIPYTDLRGIDAASIGYFKVAANVNLDDSPLSDEVAAFPPPSVSAQGRSIIFAEGATSTAENRICATLPTIMDGEGELTATLTGLPSWLEQRSDDGAQLCVKIGAEHAAPVTTAPDHLSLRYTVTESGGEQRSVTVDIQVRVDARPPPPPAESSSSSGGIVALALIGAGAYLWWKKRQIANGNAAKMAVLPDVSFDLDRNDRRAFFTRMNWQNRASSNWQLRGNATVHTKYSGKLLDWKGDSHIGYRLNGKFGDFNPYWRGKFVQNDPENTEMEETYTVGVNYAIPNRFSVQFLQPDDEIWRYSLKTELHLPTFAKGGISLRLEQPDSDVWRYKMRATWRVTDQFQLAFARPSSDLPDYSLRVKYQTPRGFSVSLSQPNSEVDNYSLGLQWRGDSKVRYFISGETVGNAYRFGGSIAF